MNTFYNKTRALFPNCHKQQTLHNNQLLIERVVVNCKDDLDLLGTDQNYPAKNKYLAAKPPRVAAVAKPIPAEAIKKVNCTLQIHAALILMIWSTSGLELL
ncbi:hypothetical protein ACJX0J_014199, partial [Zea mays]